MLRAVAFDLKAFFTVVSRDQVEGTRLPLPDRASPRRQH